MWCLEPCGKTVLWWWDWRLPGLWWEVGAISKKFSFKLGTCWFDLRKNVDWIENVRKSITLGRTWWIFGVGLKLVTQAAKGLKDNIDHFRRRDRRWRGFADNVPSWRAFSTTPIVQMSRVIGTRQHRSDQCRLRDDLESLKYKIRVHPSTLQKLKRHKVVLRELAKDKNALKWSREHLQTQQRSEFWRGRGECFKACRC